MFHKHRDPYITEDERKLAETDVATIRRALTATNCVFFNVFVNRLVPDWDAAEIIDRGLLNLLWPIRRLLAGRIVLTGRIPFNTTQ